MRIILYTGKGGVGKTSISAATACNIANKGKKVLVMSTDQAHSLSDSFGIKLGNEPKEICKNLYAMEIDTVTENEKIWGGLKSYIKELLAVKSEKSIESEELLVFPGFEELISLIKIKDISDEDKYDVLIVDCAPTGETMSLLKFPDLFKWWMDKIFPMKRKGAKIAKPIVEKTIKIPMPEDSTFDDIEELYNTIEKLHEIMLDKEKVSLRIVTTPEKIVVKEAKRNFSYLHLFDYNVDGIFINKIMPEESTIGYFEKWANIQRKNIEEVKNSFSSLPIFQINLLEKELKDYETLTLVGNDIYRDVDAEDIFFKAKIFDINKIDDSYVLSVNMPFVEKDQLELSQNGDEISIAIKNEKRVIALPKKLQGKDITGAKYEEGRLNIIFN